MQIFEIFVKFLVKFKRFFYKLLEYFDKNDTVELYWNKSYKAIKFSGFQK